MKIPRATAASSLCSTKGASTRSTPMQSRGTASRRRWRAPARWTDARPARSARIRTSPAARCRKRRLPKSKRFISSRSRPASRWWESTIPPAAAWTKGRICSPRTARFCLPPTAFPAWCRRFRWCSAPAWAPGPSLRPGRTWSSCPRKAS